MHVLLYTMSIKITWTNSFAFQYFYISGWGSIAKIFLLTYMK